MDIVHTRAGGVVLQVRLGATPVATAYPPALFPACTILQDLDTGFAWIRGSNPAGDATWEQVLASGGGGGGVTPIVFDGGVGIEGEDSGGTPRSLAKMVGDVATFGDPAVGAALVGAVVDVDAGTAAALNVGGSAKLVAAAAAVAVAVPLLAQDKVQLSGAPTFDAAQREMGADGIGMRINVPALGAFSATVAGSAQLVVSAAGVAATTPTLTATLTGDAAIETPAAIRLRAAGGDMELLLAPAGATLAATAAGADVAVMAADRVDVAAGGIGTFAAGADLLLSSATGPARLRAAAGAAEVLAEAGTALLSGTTQARVVATAGPAVVEAQGVTGSVDVVAAADLTLRATGAGAARLFSVAGDVAVFASAGAASLVASGAGATALVRSDAGATVVTAGGAALTLSSAGEVTLAAANHQNIAVTATGTGAVTVSAAGATVTLTSAGGVLLQAAAGQGVASVAPMANPGVADIPAGAPVYAIADGQVAAAVATAAATAKLIGVTPALIAAGGTGLVASSGSVVVPFARQQGGAWVAGDDIFVDAATAGDFTRVAPGLGLFVQPVGRIWHDAGGSSVVLYMNFGPMSPGV